MLQEPLFNAILCDDKQKLMDTDKLTLLTAIQYTV